MSDTRSKSYFTLPHPFWMVTIPFGLWLLAMAKFVPKQIPAILGPVAEFGTYVGVTYPKYVNYIAIVALSLHLLESVIAFRICRKRNMESVTTAKWTLQTFMFGFAFLIRLVPQKRLEFIPGSAKTKNKDK